jgi:colicin import membrane protein
VKQPDIATEKAKKKLEEEKEKKAELEQARKEKALKDKAEREKKEKELAEKKKIEDQKKLAEKKKQDELRKAAERRDALEADKRHKENVARMMGQVSGTGGQGKDSQSAGSNGAPSSGYAGRVRAKVSPNIRYSEEFPRSLRTEIEVRTTPDGTITGRRVVESSGNPAWDEAALKAIDRTGSLPRDIDGRVPTPIIIVVRPTD